MADFFLRTAALQAFVSDGRSPLKAQEAIQVLYWVKEPDSLLRVLRESGFATMRAVGTRRLYALDPAGIEGAAGWLADLRAQWSQRLDALDTELARGRRRRRTSSTQEGVTR